MQNCNCGAYQFPHRAGSGRCLVASAAELFESAFLMPVDQDTVVDYTFDHTLHTAEDIVAAMAEDMDLPLPAFMYDDLIDNGLFDEMFLQGVA